MSKPEEQIEELEKMIISAEIEKAAHPYNKSECDTSIKQCYHEISRITKDTEQKIRKRNTGLAAALAVVLMFAFALTYLNMAPAAADKFSFTGLAVFDELTGQSLLGGAGSKGNTITSFAVSDEHINGMQSGFSPALKPGEDFVSVKDKQYRIIETNENYATYKSEEEIGVLDDKLSITFYPEHIQCAGTRCGYEIRIQDYFADEVCLELEDVVFDRKDGREFKLHDKDYGKLSEEVVEYESADCDEIVGNKCKVKKAKSNLISGAAVEDVAESAEVFVNQTIEVNETAGNTLNETAEIAVNETIINETVEAVVNETIVNETAANETSETLPEEITDDIENLCDRVENNKCYVEKARTTKSYVNNGRICNKNHERTITGSFEVEAGSSGKFDVILPLLGKEFVIDPFWFSTNISSSSSFASGTFNSTELNESGFIQLGTNTSDEVMYNTSGTYDSQIFDALINTSWHNITWSANFTINETTNMTLNVTIKTCDDSACSGEGWNQTFASDASPAQLNVINNRYFQYKLFFWTPDYNVTPKFYNLTVEYNFPPIQAQPLLNSTTSFNRSDENLTVYNMSTNDTDYNDVKNIINWKRNSAPAILLNLPFEGGSNNTWSRDYVYGNNVTRIGTTVIWNETGGYDGKGDYQFTGVGSAYLNVSGDLSKINFGTKNWTIEFWFKPTVISQNTHLLQFITSTDTFYIVHRTAGYLTGFVSADTSASPTLTTTWQHIAFVSDSGILRIYRNGINGTNGSVSSASFGTTSAIRIGGSNALSENGAIDDFKIWNRSLTQEQIQAIFNNRTDLIVANETTKSEIWQACITPNDGIVDGNETCSNNITIVNVPPNATNIFTNATSSLNQTNDNVTVYFTYTDADSDAMLYNETMWFNVTGGVGIEAPEFRNYTTLWAANTTKNQTWIASVRVFDTQYNRSEWWNSTNITIANTPPIQSQPVLNTTENANTTTANLTVFNVSTSDADNDNVRNIIDWKKNGTSIALLNMPFEYYLNNNSGNITKDYSGNRVNGSVVYAVWNATGGYDGKGAYQFNRSAYIKTSNVVVGSKFTVEAWVKPNANNQGGFTRIVENHYTLGFYLGADSTGTKYKLIVKSSSDPYGNAQGGTIAANQWQHVVGVFNGSNGTLYINGAEVASSIFTAPSNYNAPIYIGRDSSVSSGYWNGSIDEVRIYNITLSAEQVKALYNNRTDLITASDTTKNETWQACITPNDGFVDGNQTCSNNITIANTPPNATNIFTNTTSSLNHTNDNVTVYFTYTDADNDTMRYNETMWFNSTGGSITEAREFRNYTTLWAANTTKNQTWIASIRVYDGQDWSIWYNSTNITIANTPPNATNIFTNATSSLNQTNDNVTVYFTYTDADSDAMLYNETMWFNVTGGVGREALEFRNYTTLWAANTTKNQTWIASVRVYDSENNRSEWWNSTNITIANTIPTFTFTNITPIAPITNDTLRVNVTAADVDNDLITIVVSWFVNNVLSWWETFTNIVSGTTVTSNLSGTNFSHYDNITAQVVVSDSQNNATPQNTSQVNISNTVPTVPINITPTNGTFREEVNVSCYGSTDIDNDALLYTIQAYYGLSDVYAWRNLTLYDTDGNFTWNTTLVDAQSNITLRCLATDIESNSSWFYGSSLFYNITILHNQEPTHAAPIISPSAAFTLDNLTCLNQSTSDADGNAVTNYFAWFKEGMPMNVTTQVLDHRNTSHFDNITCQATPYDSTVNGTAKNSSARQIINSPPNLTSLEAPPALDYVTQNNLTLNWSDSSDNDSDTIQYELLISNVSTFASTLVNKTATASEYVNSTVPVGEPLFWKVRVYDSYNYTPYTAARNFTLDYARINLTSPANSKIVYSSAQETFRITELMRHDWIENVSLTILGSTYYAQPSSSTADEPVNWTYSYAIPNIDPQTISVEARGYNNSNTAQYTSGTISLRLSKLPSASVGAPVLARILPTKTNVETNASVNLTIAVKADTLVNETIATAKYPDNNILTVTAFNQTQAGLNYTYNYTFIMNQSGSYLFTFTVIDINNLNATANLSLSASVPEKINITALNALSIKVKDSNTAQVFLNGSVNQTTFINQTLPVGNYEVEVTFAKPVVTFTDAHLDNNTVYVANYTDIEETVTPPANRRSVETFEIGAGTNFTNATILYNYSNMLSSIANEANLEVWKAESTAGPWTSLPKTINITTHEITAYTSNFSIFMIVEPTSITTVSTSTSSGGGGSTSIEFVNVSSDFYLKVEAPSPVKMISNEIVTVPVKLVNTGTRDLKGITLFVRSNSSDISPSLKKRQFSELPAQAIAVTDLTLESHTKPGYYLVFIDAFAENPKGNASKVVIIDLVEDSNQTPQTRLNFARDLFNKNPECLELRELIKQADQKLGEGQTEEAMKLTSDAITGCSELLRTKEVRLEQPRSLAGYLVLPTRLALLGEIALIVFIITLAYLVLGPARKKIMSSRKTQTEYKGAMLKSRSLSKSRREKKKPLFSFIFGRKKHPGKGKVGKKQARPKKLKQLFE